MKCVRCSQYSGQAMEWMAMDLCFDSWQWQQIFEFWDYKKSYPVRRRDLFLGVKRPGYEADRLAEFYNLKLKVNLLVRHIKRHKSPERE